MYEACSASGASWPSLWYPFLFLCVLLLLLFLFLFGLRCNLLFMHKAMPFPPPIAYCINAAHHPSWHSFPRSLRLKVVARFFAHFLLTFFFSYFYLFFSYFSARCSLFVVFIKPKNFVVFFVVLLHKFDLQFCASVAKFSFRCNFKLNFEEGNS